VNKVNRLQVIQCFVALLHNSHLNLGLDWGGLRREWIELLCVAIFDRRHSGLFTSFSEDGQALVHPNPKMPASCKLKHYEFAGKLVGKCLYESSLVK
jgi:hypothetical protein